MRMDLSQSVVRRTSGAMFFVAAAAILLGIITAEALYPGYHTADNMISDLGGTEPPGSIVVEPSATIFDTTMIVTGVLIIAAAALLHFARGRLVITVPTALMGIGVLGVGLFPGPTGGIHALFAQLTFFAGGASAVLAFRVTRSPFRFLSLLLGVVTLANLLLYFALGDAYPMAGLGLGGLERWIAYPVVIWLLGFGGYLMAAGGTGDDRLTSGGDTS